MSTIRSKFVKSLSLVLVALAVIVYSLSVWESDVVQAAQNLAALLQPGQGSPPKTVPGVFNYQGVLRDGQGNPVANGEYTVILKIYDEPVAGNELYSETQEGVIVRDGRFGVTLGFNAPLPARLFTGGADRFVGVTVQPFQEMQPRQRLGSVPYAVQAEHAYNGVPVGAVIDWWRPDPSFEVPDGYLICAGQQVTDSESPLYGKQLPNLNDKFIRGTTDPQRIGQLGGNDMHTHSIGHDHPPAAAVTQPGGAHAHRWAYRDTGDDYFSWDQAGNLRAFNTWHDGMDGVTGKGFYPLEIPHNISGWTERGGEHTHNVTVDLPEYNGLSGAGSTLPAYVTLLKLCRVR